MITSFIRRIATINSLKIVENSYKNHIFHSRNLSDKVQTSIENKPPAKEDKDSDKFGTLGNVKNQYEYAEGDLGDKREEERMKKWHSKEYDNDLKWAKQIKALLKERKVSEALSILESGNIAKPEGYVYGLLIRACGNVGYTKKAFQLYNQMKKRGISIRSSVYTSLFNACSNSPWKEDGLSRATHLLNSLEDKGYEPNAINYNAMIKAFGRGGDIIRAFCLVDQMIDKRIAIDSSTFAFLLQACASDKEAGFRHAVMVWNKMLKNGIQPTIYTYNLILKCCKECGAGDGIDIKYLSLGNNALRISGGNTQASKSSKKEILTLPLHSKEDDPHTKISTGQKFDQGPRENDASQIEKVVLHEGHMERKSANSAVVSGGDKEKSQVIVNRAETYVIPVTPPDRLQCLGGCSKFLEQMAQKGVQPNVKTFTQLLEVIPSTESAEKELILALKKSGVKEDVEFYNMVIKKKTMRFDYKGAREVLATMSSAGLTPNIMTFGILSMGCTNKEETAILIAAVKDAGFRLNAEMIGAMVKGACFRWDVYHVLELMELCIKEEIRPNPRLLQHLQSFKTKMIEASKHENSNSEKISDRYGRRRCSRKAFETYLKRLASWLKEIDLTEAEDLHPWQQYRRHHKKDDSEVSETVIK